MIDSAIAVAVTIAYINLAGVSEGPPVFAGPSWLGYLVAAGVGLPLAVRRRWPVAVLAVVLAALTAATVLDITREPYLPAAIALYSVGRLCPIRPATGALAGALVVSAIGVSLGQLVITPSASTMDAAMLVALVWLACIGAWAAGAVARRWAAEAVAAADQARAASAAAERLAIARELHDLVSHNLSLIAVQAGVANHVAAEHPDRALATLREIETTSRRALAEMRSMLTVLRAGPGTVDRPIPGLNDLPELVESARSAGLAVDFAPDGLPADVPSDLQLTAYRVVQEALTNVVRHAGPARCTVRVAVDGARLRVEVVDDGEGPAGDGADGHGLNGLRERVALHGGTFEAAAASDRGFAVRVALPLPEAA